MALTPPDEVERINMAALAAGIGISWYTNTVFQHDYPCRGHVTRPWLPHKDDGDCARLEATLGLSVGWLTNGVSVIAPGGEYEVWRVYGDFDGDRNATRRAAVLEAAAQLGRRM